jgi:hypothetical protein
MTFSSTVRSISGSSIAAGVACSEPMTWRWRTEGAARGNERDIGALSMWFLTPETTKTLQSQVK